MKKSQLSLEFIILFSIAFFVFLSIFYYITTKVSENDTLKELAENKAKEIKIKVITASLSDTNFETNFILSSKIKNIDIRTEFYDGKSTSFAIIEEENNRTLAFDYLPTVDNLKPLVNKRLILSKKEGLNLIIKKFNNHLSLERV
jgi:hypothetical protein